MYPCIDTEPVSIIGATGALGFGLALQLGRAGVPVVLGSRDAGRAAAAAEKLRKAVPDGAFDGLENAAAASACEIVFLCVPFPNHAENLLQLRGSLRGGQLLVDGTVPLAAPLGGKATRTVTGLLCGIRAPRATR